MINHPNELNASRQAANISSSGSQQKLRSFFIQTPRSGTCLFHVYEHQNGSRWTKRCWRCTCGVNKVCNGSGWLLICDVHHLLANREVNIHWIPADSVLTAQSSTMTMTRSSIHARTKNIAQVIKLGRLNQQLKEKPPTGYSCWVIASCIYHKRLRNCHASYPTCVLVELSLVRLWPALTHFGTNLWIRRTILALVGLLFRFSGGLLSWL